MSINFDAKKTEGPASSQVADPSSETREHAAVPALEYRDVAFSYPGAADADRITVNFQIPQGAFALLTGPTGSGKTTVMRLAKPQIAPAGDLSGRILAFGTDVQELSPAESARAIGYVFQNPDNQIVCDTVWHELAFGLENLGTPEPQMRRIVAETCNFFGIEPWFRAQTAELSGGQRQLLALAATLAMRPRLLLLDEPTSMLDPVAQKSFLALLFRANRELGITVVMATHEPRPMIDYATCGFVVANKRVEPVDLADLARPRPLEPLPPRPDASRVVPQAAGERGRRIVPGNAASQAAAAPALLLDGVWFRYERDADWILRGLDLRLVRGEVRALVGGNGCGKSTLLSLAAGVTRPQRGRVRNELASSQALLPQGPKSVLACETVRDELAEWSQGAGYGPDAVDAALAELGLESAADRHPYDLSGGQQQLLALQKLLLTHPDLLFLDEPTKGLDDAARAWAVQAVGRARDRGATVLLATHDMAFAAAVADSVSLMFDGAITCTQPAAEFFESSWLYRP